MQTPPPQRIEVLHPSDVGTARRAAKAAAEELGFAPEACEQIALATTELATNLVKHARAGRLFLTRVIAEGRAGLEIESQDSGPGIADVKQAMTDGFSTVGSRGVGLGAVNRLMDEFDITSRRGSGTRIVCRKWVRVHPGSTRNCPLEFGVATRPRFGCKENGDTFVVRQWGESALVGIIDGLGHGPLASRAAQAARNYVETHFDLPLDRIFTGAGYACRSTRGVVMALVRFDWGQERLSFASVGNIGVRVFPRSDQLGFPTRRGILGVNAPSAKVSEYPWGGTNIMVLHSDGMRTHWSWKDFPGLVEKSASDIARILLREQGRDEDDATAVVIRRAAR